MARRKGETASDVIGIVRGMAQKWVDLNEPAPARVLADVPARLAEIGYSCEEAGFPGTYVALFRGTNVSVAGVSFRAVRSGSHTALRVYTGLVYAPSRTVTEDLAAACGPLLWVEGCALLGFDASATEPQLTSPVPLMLMSNPALLPGEGTWRIANVTDMAPAACVGVRDGEFVQLVNSLGPVPLLSIGYEFPWTDAMTVTLMAAVGAVGLLAELLVLNHGLLDELGGIPVWG